MLQTRAAYFFLMIPALLGQSPINVYPGNPHYFVHLGKPSVLIISAEHYGAVLNLRFNYEAYLDELKR